MLIAKQEVLRYLGYLNQKMDKQMDDLIDSCIGEIELIAKPRFTYQILDIEVAAESVYLINYQLQIKGKSIARHLEYAKQCVLYAATLGAQVDKKIEQYQVTDMTRGVVLDACGTAAVESLCDEVDKIVTTHATKMGLKTTSRYSPGYGDCSLDIQPNLLKIIDASIKIGLSCTNQCLLLPKKSVTTIIGLVQIDQRTNVNRCDDCNDKVCRYRRR